MFMSAYSANRIKLIGSIVVTKDEVYILLWVASLFTLGGRNRRWPLHLRTCDAVVARGPISKYN